MKAMKKYLFIFTVLFLIISGCSSTQEELSVSESSQSQVSPVVEADKLAVLWTSGDPEVAHRVCFMYTQTAKRSGWFDQVQLIVWGPSSKLLSEDKSLQDKVKAMIADGIDVKACKACADSYGVADKLTELGVDVQYMGIPLTRILKSKDWKLLTF